MGWVLKHCRLNYCLIRIISDVDISVIMIYCFIKVIKTNTGKSNINVKIDAVVKEKAILLLDQMGIDQTTAIDMFYRQIIVERCLPFQPRVTQIYVEQVLDLIKRKKIPNITLSTDKNGNAFIDKEQHPDLYDWAVNG